jgi:hypothetical protein
MTGLLSALAAMTGDDAVQRPAQFEADIAAET